MKFSDLSEPEKVTLQSFWSQCPDERSTTGDSNDPTLGEIEKRLVHCYRRAVRQGGGADFTFGDPVGRSKREIYISLGKDFPFQNLYCANCGTQLNKLEDNFEFACDCALESDLDLTTYDPNEHIRRKQLNRELE